MTLSSRIQGARALPTLPSATQRHWLGAIVSEQFRSLPSSVCAPHSGQRQCLECFPLWPVRLVAIGFYSERVLCCDNKSPARVKAPRPARKESNGHPPAFLAERSRGLARCRLSVGNYGGRL